MISMKTTVRTIIAASVATALMAFAGCGGSGGGSGEGAGKQAGGEKTASFVYVNWAEGVAMTNLAKVILEDKLGYEDVTLTMADVAPVYTAIANGDADAFMDAWLPVTHESYMEKYGEKLVDLGYNYEGARIGLVVPSYFEAQSISDLNGMKDAIDGEIIGIDSGAGIMKATEKAIGEYGLDITLLPSSGPAMTASLKRAIDDNEPIVVTGWKPHWMFARFDIKFLDDPKGVYGATENIHCIVRNGLETDKPDMYAMLKNFKMDDQQLGGLMDTVRQQEGDPAAAARAWMAENKQLVDSWLQ